MRKPALKFVFGLRALTDDVATRGKQNSTRFFITFFFSIFSPPFCVHCLHICNFRQHLQVSHLFFPLLNSISFFTFIFLFFFVYFFSVSFSVCVKRMKATAALPADFQHRPQISPQNWNKKKNSFKHKRCRVILFSLSRCCCRCSCSMLLLYSLFFHMRKKKYLLLLLIYRVAFHLSFRIQFYFLFMCCWCLKTLNSLTYYNLHSWKTLIVFCN